MASVQPIEKREFERGATLAWLRGVMWLAVVVPVVLFVVVAWSLHREAIAQAQFRIDSAARVGEEHALKVFETNIALLNRVGDALGDESDVQLQVRERQLHDQLVNMSANLQQLQGIFVIGANGSLVVTNRLFPAPRAIDYSDRGFFRHHRDGGAQPVFFSERLTSRTTGEPFFDMSVRRARADGSLAHVLSASMAPGYFAGFYGELAGNDHQLNIALVRSDGEVLARWPDVATARNTPGAPLAATNSADGHIDPMPTGLADARQLVADRRLTHYPVHVIAWIDRSAALAPWYRQVALLAGFGFPSAVVLMYVAWVALQRTRRSLQVLHRLEDETAHRQHIEEALRQAQKLEALGRLSGGIAHDFNNLLMVVGNNVFLLRKLQPALADSAQLAAIERATAAGTKLTRQLLSFSRRQALRPEQVQLQQRLPSVLELLAPALGAGIQLDAHVEPDAARIEVDVAELELALLNLAINARDAMPAGGRLQIAVANAPAGEPAGLASSTNPAGRFVVIAVSDTGQGIAPELLERVFEPFFTTKGVGIGTGLGLSQVYGFCVRAGGTATLRSSLGEGTTVSLYFPAGLHAAPPVLAAPSSETEPLRGLRVLLVEDNDEVASATRLVLQSMGCEVRRLDGADMAIELLRTQARAFDIMLSDIVMGGSLDGIELAARTRVDHPALPVLLMSGYSDSMQRATELSLDILPKPCTPEALSIAIRTALARPLAVSTA